MKKTITINKTKIGENYPPYVIAEMSANHNGNINDAFQIIKKAKKSGANAVKIQTYKPNTITIKSEKPDFMIKDGLWEGRSLYDLYEWAHCAYASNDKNMLA